MFIQIFTHVKFAENKRSWQWEDLSFFAEFTRQGIATTTKICCIPVKISAPPAWAICDVASSLEIQAYSPHSGERGGREEMLYYLLDPTYPVSGIIVINNRWIAERHIQIILLKIFIFMKSQVQYSKTQLSFLLIHLSCQILKLCFTVKAIQVFV